MPVSDSTFDARVVVPLMLAPRIWLQRDENQVLQIGFLIETQIVASYEEDARISSVWWPYGRSLLSNKLQVIFLVLVWDC